MLILITVLFYISVNAFSQDITTLIFTGKTADEQNYVRLDSVLIKNVSRDWEETIYYPDTIINLHTSTTGIENAETQNFGIKDLNPNPFNGVARFNLAIPESGEVNFQISDLNGKLVVVQNENLESGIYSFEISLQQPATYVVSAISANGKSTEKIINVGNGTQNYIKQIGGNGAIEFVLQTKTTSTNEFHPGDVMQYTGYTTYNDEVYTSASILQAQNVTEFIDLLFDITFCETRTYEFAETACESYNWNNEIYETSGDYVQNFETLNGCDSVVTLHLTINNSVTYEFAETVCESYNWNNETYTTSGDYIQNFTAENGCDSVVTLHLTINNSVTYEFAETVCESYNWNNETYTTSGDYVQEFEAINGCDSIVTLHLTINATSVNEIFDTVFTSPYTWNGIEYTLSGNYTQTLEAANGCDSVVNLHLTLYKKTIITANGVNFTMVPVEGGTFYMGAQSTDPDGLNYEANARSDESPVHSVTLNNFYIGETEVTQALWLAVMGSWPNDYPSSSGPYAHGQGDNYPAYYLTYGDCVTFIEQLNNLTGRTFRLPTEAEWEYAARGGNLSRGYVYSGADGVGNVAWYYSNAAGDTHNVKQKLPNELGLYDMTGNVREWCSDWYGTYSSEVQINPTGPTNGTYRVTRGGNFTNTVDYLHISCRFNTDPESYTYSIGFRLVMVEE